MVHVDLLDPINQFKPLSGKVIIHMLCRGVSLIEYVSQAIKESLVTFFLPLFYFNTQKCERTHIAQKKNPHFSYLYFMQLFSTDPATLSFFFKIMFTPEIMKKPPSKVAPIGPNFFSVLPTGPKLDQISNIFHRNLPLCNFYIMTLLSGKQAISHQVELFQ